MAGKQINAILSLTDKFSTPLFKVAGNAEKATSKMKSQVSGLNRMANRAERRMDQLVKNAFKWGKRMAIAGAGISLKVGWEGIKELDDGARKVKSIAKDALELGEIKDGLLELSGKTGIDVADIAEAQYMAISSSVDPKDSLAYAELATKMSKAGFADARAAIDLVTSMQNAYGEKGIGNAMKMADQFLHTQNRGKIEIAEMTQHYGKLIPLFSQAGVGYDQMNAAMATLTKMGMKPAEASTALAGAMRIMMNPTKQASEALAELGIEFGATELEAKGFVGLMEQVWKATDGDMDKITKIFPNARAMLAGAALSGEEGMKEMKEILEELNSDEITGGLDEAYETIQGSIGNQWEILKQNLKGVNTKFYMQYEGNLAEKLQEINKWFEENPEKVDRFVEKISDGINKVIDTIGDLFDFIKRNQDTFKSIGLFLGTLYGALKLLRGLSKIKGIIELIGGLSVASLGPVGLAILAIATAINAVYAAWKKYQKIKDKMSRMPKTEAGDNMPQMSIDGMENETAVLTDFEESLVEVAERMEVVVDNSERLQDALERIQELFSDDGWKDMTFLELLGELIPPLGELVDKLETLKGLLEIIKDNFGDRLAGIAQMFEGIATKDWGTFKEGVKRMIGIADTVERVQERFPELLETNLIFNDGDTPQKLEGLNIAWEESQGIFGEPIEADVDYSDNDAPSRLDRVKGIWDETFGVITTHPLDANVNYNDDNAPNRLREVRNQWDQTYGLITDPMDSRINFNDGGAPGGLSDIRGKWDNLKRESNNPISLIINITRNLKERFTPAPGSQKMGPNAMNAGRRHPTNYSGSHSWRGGVTSVHEKGGEILNLPSGTRIFPHDKSVREAYNEGKAQGSPGGTPVVVNFNGDLYGDDEYLVNRVGQGIADKIITELANM